MKHCLRVSEWNDWDDYEMAEKKMTMAFDDKELTLLELDNHILRNGELLFTELNRRFDPFEHAEAREIEFRSRCRKPNESFMLYTHDIKRMFTKAYP